MCRAGNSTCTEISKNVTILHNSLLKIRHHIAMMHYCGKRSLGFLLLYALESWKNQSSKLIWDELLSISLSPLPAFFFLIKFHFFFFHQYLFSNILEKYITTCYPRILHNIPPQRAITKDQTPNRLWAVDVPKWLDEGLDLAKSSWE